MGWSQRQLKEASGYSERLISKAESNGRIVLATLVDLAEALSTPQEMVRPEQLIHDPVAVAKSITHATYVLQRNMFSRMQHMISEDFVLEAIGDPHQFPFTGRYVGPEGFRLAVDKFFSFMEVPKNVDYTQWYDYFQCPEDENVVVVWGQSWIHPIGKPLVRPLDITQRVEIQNGKIVYFENRYDASSTMFENFHSAASR
jgi:transcriptional regulator with XRE-family HTH domain